MGQGETIMVVEDDGAILELIESVLKNLKYNVLCASNPKDALRLTGGYSGEIDLLVTDIVMPEMNGRELSNELIKQYPDLRVLYMSGYTVNVIIHRGVLDEGINYIAKPFSLDDFARKVREVLNTQSLLE